MREVLGEAYVHEGRLTRTFFFWLFNERKYLHFYGLYLPHWIMADQYWYLDSESGA